MKIKKNIRNIKWKICKLGTFLWNFTYRVYVIELKKHVIKRICMNQNNY